MDWFVKTPDGRTLAVEDAGDRGGRPVMVHVGTPGGRGAPAGPGSGGGVAGLARPVRRRRAGLARWLQPGGCRGSPADAGGRGRSTHIFFSRSGRNCWGCRPPRRPWTCRRIPPMPTWRCSPTKRSLSSRPWRPGSKDPGTIAWHKSPRGVAHPGRRSLVLRRRRARPPGGSHRGCPRLAARSQFLTLPPPRRIATRLMWSLMRNRAGRPVPPRRSRISGTSNRLSPNAGQLKLIIRIGPRSGRK
jgi:hypothetical protein